jgi:hypothetical protein
MADELDVWLDLQQLRWLTQVLVNAMIDQPDVDHRVAHLWGNASVGPLYLTICSDDGEKELGTYQYTPLAVDWQQSLVLNPALPEAPPASDTGKPN